MYLLFAGHDDRGGESSADRGMERRVSFKNQIGGNKLGRRRGWDNKLRAVLLDEDDVDMIANTQQFGGRK